MNLKKKIAITQKLFNKVQAVHTLEKKKQIKFVDLNLVFISSFVYVTDLHNVSKILKPITFANQLNLLSLDKTIQTCFKWSVLN